MKKSYKGFMRFDLLTEGFKATIGGAGIAYRMPPSEEERLAILEEFGWGNSNNSNVYHPDANAEAIAPKPEDYINVPFRLISATTVAAGTWRATEFPEDVLEASMAMLDGKPLYPSHDTDELENIIGHVSAPKWSAKKRVDGMTIPAGIDGIVSIDTKTNPKIARHVLAGDIGSNSVTVMFNWKPSHQYEKEWEFSDALGTMHPDGTMVRRIVTEILAYYESSLVFLGADPYAKALDDKGNPKNIDKPRTYNAAFSLEAEAVKKGYIDNKTFEADQPLTKELLTLSNAYSQTNQTKKTMPPKILALVLAFLGLEKPEQLTDDHAAQLGLLNPDKLAKLKADQKAALSLTGGAALEGLAETHALVPKTELEGYKAEISQAKETLATKESEIVALKAQAQVSLELQTKQRAEVERLYTIANGTPSKAMLSLMEKATLEELDEMAKQYGGKAVKEFGGHCKSCGSNEITFQQSVPDPNNAPVAPKKEALTPSDIREKYSR